MNARTSPRLLIPATLTALATATVTGAVPATYCVQDLGALDGPSQALAFAAAGTPVGSSVNAASNFRAVRLGGPGAEDLGPIAPLSQSIALAGGGGAAYVGAFTPGTPGYLGQIVPPAPGAVTPLGDLLPQAVSGTGLVVGVRSEITTDQLRFDRACAGTGGTITTLKLLSGGLASGARAVNDTGWIVGWSMDSSNRRPRPTLWPTLAAKPVDLGVLGTPSAGATAQATAINAAGLIAGYSSTRAGPMHACTWLMRSPTRVRTRTDLGALAPGASSFAAGINSAGEVVGTSDGRAFIHSGGVMIDLNTRITPGSGWTLQAATAIDPDGRIIGWGLHDGRPAAFMLALTCAADLAGLGRAEPDGLVNVDDVIAFVDSFVSGEGTVPGRAGAADIAGPGGAAGPDGVLSADDAVAFVESYLAGCGG